jgi:kynurenine formamidase
MIADTQAGDEKKAIAGHLGTHFDVMKKEFPLDYVERNAIVFDVSSVKEREILITDIDFEKIKKDMCIVFYTGFIEQEGYGTKSYFQDHPQLSNDLIDKLLEKKFRS